MQSAQKFRYECYLYSDVVFFQEYRYLSKKQGSTTYPVSLLLYILGAYVLKVTQQSKWCFRNFTEISCICKRLPAHQEFLTVSFPKQLSTQLLKARSPLSGFDQYTKTD